MESRQEPPTTRRWLARRAATIAASMGMDRVRTTTVRRPDEVPGRAADLTTDWLTATLCRDVDDATVVAFTTPGGSSGTSERVGLRVEYNAAGKAAGLPTELFMKLSSSYRQRLLLGGAGALRGETDFFMRFRPRVEIEAPKGYWGGVDERTWKSIVIMEDIAATKGATFSEPVTPVTRAEIEDLLQNMARFHGALWQDLELPVLRTPLQHLKTISAFISMEERCRVGMERSKSVIAPTLYGEAARLWEGLRRCLALATNDMPRTLLHGDSHIGQTYRTADGRMGLTDWQITLQGGWAYDVAYLIGSSCEPEERRAWDRELLAGYLERLTEHGGHPPAIEDAWRLYCSMLFYPYAAFAFTIGRAAYQPRMQPDEYSLAILRRASAAIEDNESFRAVGL